MSLYDYTGNALDVLGEFDVHVEVRDSSEATVQICRLFVIRGSGHSLFGQNWLKLFRLDWKKLVPIVNAVKNLTANEKLEIHLGNFEEIYRNGRGSCSIL